MLTSALPPLRPSGRIDFGETLQCHSLTYLAKYNDSALPARVLLAFQRAWGINDITFFPRVDGGRPGFLVARIIDTEVNHLIVAVESSESTGQYYSLFQRPGSTQWNAPTRHVFNVWNTHFLAIKTILDSYGPFTAALAARETSIWFTGFSLGAAISELLCESYANANPTKRFFNCKFGSPRVGNGYYVRGRNPNTVRKSVYTERDPITAYPSATYQGDIFGITIPVVNYTSYADDPDGHRYNYRFESIGGIDREPEGSYLFGAINALQEMNPSNRWWPHLNNSYRTMFSNAVYSLGTWGRDRYLFLEYPDDNQWQFRFRPQQEFDPTWISFDSTPPATVDPTVNFNIPSQRPGTVRARFIPVVQEIIQAERPWSNGDGLPSARRTFRRQ